LKSILKTAVYILDQTDRTAADVRDRVSGHVDRVSNRVSDLADQGKSVIYGEDHTLRHVLLFTAGLGVGLGAGILLAPSSGEELRSSMREKVEDIGDRVRGPLLLRHRGSRHRHRGRDLARRIVYWIAGPLGAWELEGAEIQK